jgi:hypothetical protein
LGRSCLALQHPRGRHYSRRCDLRHLSPRQVGALTITAASILSDHYPTHAQLFESPTHSIYKAFCYIIDGDRLAALSSALRITSSTVMSTSPCAQRSAEHYGGSAARQERLVVVGRRRSPNKWERRPLPASFNLTPAALDVHRASRQDPPPLRLSSIGASRSLARPLGKWRTGQTTPTPQNGNRVARSGCGSTMRRWRSSIALAGRASPIPT